MKITTSVRCSLVKAAKNSKAKGITRRNKKGVSSVIGMAIFLLLFAIAVTYVFTWSQDQGTLVDTIKHQTDIDKNRLSENLVVTAMNNTALTVSNPTSQAAVVTQIWSNHTQISASGMEQGISPFGNFTFNFNSSLANGNFEVVTLAGNTYSAGLQSQFAKATAQSWQVTWYYGLTAPANPSNLSNGTYSKIASSYWYDLNFYWEWAVASNPVIANYNLSYQSPCTNIIGFMANTTVIKTTDSSSNASINYNIDNKSQCQIAIDGVLQPANTTSVQFGGPLYYVHNITIYYYMPTTNPNDITSLKLNIVNATFTP